MAAMSLFPLNISFWCNVLFLKANPSNTGFLRVSLSLAIRKSGCDACEVVARTAVSVCDRRCTQQRHPGSVNEAAGPERRAVRTQPQTHSTACREGRDASGPTLPVVVPATTPSSLAKGEEPRGFLGCRELPAGGLRVVCSLPSKQEV